MAQSTVWWLFAGAAVAVELVTGTFYLLMLALGLVAAAIAAHLGATLTLQFTLAALLSGGAVVGWRRYKQQQPSALPASANHDVNMDVGEHVQVSQWAPDGTSVVKYRGAQWSVALVAGATPLPGTHVIVEVVGSRLMVKKV